MSFNREVNHLFLDLDGVLADFDKAAMSLMDGIKPETFEETRGTKEFWKRIGREPDFFRNLPMMPDAMVLYNATKHLRPTILTGIPSNMDAYANQKIEWVRKHFGPFQRVICCPSKKKSAFCIPGDVIVDDRTKYMHHWEEAQGRFIVHFNAVLSINELMNEGVLVF